MHYKKSWWIFKIFWYFVIYDPLDKKWSMAKSQNMDIFCRRRIKGTSREHICKLRDCFFFFWGGKMAKSLIDVVQDSPRTSLGIPVKNKKPPLSNQYTARSTAFRL